MAITDFLTIIVPYYCVIDKDFVQILAGEHLLILQSRDGDENLISNEFVPIDMGSEASLEPVRFIEEQEQIYNTKVNPSF